MRLHAVKIIWAGAAMRMMQGPAADAVLPGEHALASHTKWPIRPGIGMPQVCHGMARARCHKCNASSIRALDACCVS